MISRICKWIVFKCIYPSVYFIGSHRQVDEHKIIFVENHGELLSENYPYLMELFQCRGYETKVHYLKMNLSGWGAIVGRSIKLIWDISNAKAIFLNESNSLFGMFTLRNETKLIQVWHACGAFKKWGFSVADKQFGEDKKTLQQYSGHRNYDLVCVSGEAVCWAYEEAFGLSKDVSVVKPMGVSRTDVYYSDEKKALAKQRLEPYKEWIGGRKIVLYAPTFRGDIKTAFTPDVFDVKELSRFSERYVFFIKQHPFVKQPYSVPKECEEYCREIRGELSTEELLMVADVLITDYSSIIFEYALMRKPMIFFSHDLDAYYDERGFYYPYDTFVPGPIVKTMRELVRQIETIENFDKEKVERFVDAYMSGCDGNATKRIVEYVIG
ncbi:MAG: CDP-glycerol glycerophosphotransferase family protein [Lachnospiraceae bacterium]|nr:CDP-glycerol glycerophosphotransferase family protein [Lachnospiraceae bacterium]